MSYSLNFCISDLPYPSRCPGARHCHENRPGRSNKNDFGEPSRNRLWTHVSTCLWLVWNMTLNIPYIGNHHPNWLLCSEGLNHQPGLFVCFCLCGLCVSDPFFVSWISWGFPLRRRPWVYHGHIMAVRCLGSCAHPKKGLVDFAAAWLGSVEWLWWCKLDVEDLTVW